MKKASTIIYAVGWTQPVSERRSSAPAAILQLVHGNVGRAGGGVNRYVALETSRALPTGWSVRYFPGLLKTPNPSDTDLANS